VILTFDLLTLVAGHAWRVTWSTRPPSLKILRLSVLELWVLTSPIGYNWQCVCSHCACAVSRDRYVRGKFFPHIWNPWPRFAYSLYNFYGATIKTNGVISQNSVWPCAKDHTSHSFLRMRKVTSAFSVAVNLLPPSFLATTISNFGNLTAFRAIFSHILTAHAQKWLFMNFRLKFWHHSSIPGPRFPYRARYFRYLRTFSVDWISCMSAIFLFPVYLTYWPRKYVTWWKFPPSLKMIQPSVA